MTDEGAGRASGSHRQRRHELPGSTPEDDVMASRRVMRLLGDHIPISLILDVSARAGPDSEHLLTAEGGADQSWWEPGTATPSVPVARTPRPS